MHGLQIGLFQLHRNPGTCFHLKTNKRTKHAPRTRKNRAARRERKLSNLTAALTLWTHTWGTNPSRGSDTEPSHPPERPTSRTYAFSHPCEHRALQPFKNLPQFDSQNGISLVLVHFITIICLLAIFIFGGESAQMSFAHFPFRQLLIYMDTITLKPTGVHRGRHSCFY